MTMWTKVLGREGEGGEGGGAALVERAAGALVAIVDRDSSPLALRLAAAKLAGEFIGVGSVNKVYGVPGGGPTVEAGERLLGLALEGLRASSVDEVRIGITALRGLLTSPCWRAHCATATTAPGQLAGVLTSQAAHAQVVYEAGVAMWLLTFEPAIATAPPQSFIPALVSALKSAKKDKVVRVCLLSLASLSTSPANADTMVAASLQKPLALLASRRWADEEVTTALSDLETALDASLSASSSFDAYRAEVNSGLLSWTPVHTSPLFWSTAISDFETANYRILRTLKSLLSSEDPQVVAVAAHDVGEFARVHPFGRRIVGELGIKAPLLALLSSAHPEVRKHALYASQKLLVGEKWEYAGGE